jgi:RNA polymerase sigma-70 factor, ECF subfamily
VLGVDRQLTTRHGFQLDRDVLAQEVHYGRPMYQQNEASRPWTSSHAPPAGFRSNTGFISNLTGSNVQSERDIDDGRLIDSVLQGRTDAFGDLVVPHLGSLTRFARRRLRDDSEAEDVVQQAVLLALYNIGQFRREASFKTWLSKIAFNEVIHLRRGRAIAAASPLHQARADKLADPSCLPDMQIQRTQETFRLHRALTRLPEKYRLIIELRDLRELSIAATARSLSLTAAAVKTRHHRARKLLLRSLAGSR